MFRIVTAAVILTLCMVTMAALTAFVLLIYTRMKDDLEALKNEYDELEKKAKKLEAENFAYRIGRMKEQSAERFVQSAERRAESAVKTQE